MIGKLSIAMRLGFNITPLAGQQLVFHETFQKKMKSLAEEIGQKYKSSATVSGSPEKIYVEFAVTTEDLTELIYEFETSATILAEHGEDSDLLHKFFERYPGLINHPMAKRIIGAFDNLQRVADEVKNTKVEGQVPPIDPAALAKPAEGKGMTKEERVEHRRKALQGQLPGQETIPSNLKPPVVPAIYDKLRDTPRKQDGNVFGS